MSKVPIDPQLERFFLNPRSYPHAVENIRHLETHISHVFLTGRYAYKVKKPIRLPFLDFSTLDRRRSFCERELELNKRFAPQIYESVERIGASGTQLHFGDSGVAFEYAVKMRQFDEGSLFTELLEKQELRSGLLTDITRSIAKFHAHAGLRPDLWSPEHVRAAIEENFDALQRHPGILAAGLVTEFASKIRTLLNEKHQLIEKRQAYAVKFLHGDLHLRNIALLEGQPILFDGIEFSEPLACCDVWADIAFLIMDLHYRGRPDLANEVTNTYLEETDDYEGFALLRLYVAYRASVRAKVSCIEVDSLDDPARIRHASDSAVAHTELAVKFLREYCAGIVAIGGYSGTGKTTIGRQIAKSVNGILVRSDVTRKHMLRISPRARAQVSAYQTEIDLRVYEGLRERATGIVREGYIAVVDAVHKTPESRALIEQVAAEAGCPFWGIWCHVPLEVAKDRLGKRRGDASDADAAVAERQYAQSPGDMNWFQLETQKSKDELFDVIQQNLQLPLSS